VLQPNKPMNPNHQTGCKMSVSHLQTEFNSRQIFCKPFRYRHSAQHVVLLKGRTERTN
jgi:hypothetical protein